MAVDIYFKCEIYQKILAALVMSLRTAYAQGAINVEFAQGVVTFARVQAIAYGFSGQALMDAARAELGHELGGLLSTSTVSR